MTATTLAVPGHGEPVGREFVFEQRGRIATLAAQTRVRRQANAPTGLRRPAPHLSSLLTLYMASHAMYSVNIHAAWDVDALAHQAGLIGDHHQLRPVPGPQFDHGAAHVSARCRSAHH